MSSEDIQAASFLLNLRKEPVIMLPPIDSLLSSRPSSPSFHHRLHHIDPPSFVTTPSSSMMDIQMITHATDQDPMPSKKKNKAAASENGIQSPSPPTRTIRRRRIASNNSGGSSTTTTDIMHHRPRRTTMTSTSSSSSSVIHDHHHHRGAKGGKIRPRWRAHERLKLFLAIAEDKQLEDMSTFRWGPIACKVGRSRKACKDQWRREVYRSIVQYLEKMAAQEPTEEENESDQVDDDDEEDEEDVDDIEDE
ncbi:predicted protein [Lichtheimia corymbifera JMRC:FSU:9682]|uniref:Myb-like domain-containing protein n=1 Tax=Lichtheimia corymbifera JMRC:FSU:9682 TaxID=1263082 RepID=A0A068S3V2_9FUNG|nr:predicted protein [Lichtheimia corymbifera JMRC:FSU:9682]